MPLENYHAKKERAPGGEAFSSWASGNPLGLSRSDWRNGRSGSRKGHRQGGVDTRFPVARRQIARNGVTICPPMMQARGGRLTASPCILTGKVLSERRPGSGGE